MLVTFRCDCNGISSVCSTNFSFPDGSHLPWNVRVSIAQWQRHIKRMLIEIPTDAKLSALAIMVNSSPGHLIGNAWKRKLFQKSRHNKNEISYGRCSCVRLYHMPLFLLLCAHSARSTHHTQFVMLYSRYVLGCVHMLIQWNFVRFNFHLSKALHYSQVCL